MMTEFPIIEITRNAYELSSQEMMGSKFKFWFEHQELGLCLYKQARQNSGEDWAEKVASELGLRLGLPHAIYELASTWEGNRGVVSPCFLPFGGTLVHGNELLTPIIPNYPTSGTYRVSQHTIDIVLNIISDQSINLPLGWTKPNGIETATQVFVGYLLLDAWIGNGDRHHENWGLIRTIVPNFGETLYLAPTFDHASSLGRDLDDFQRQKRSVEAYTNKCFSAFYGSVDDKKPLKTFDVFQRVAHLYPQASYLWLKQLRNISKENILTIFSYIPNSRISSITSEFAQKILEFNQNKILKLEDLLS
ncbi:MAG TPA: HipA-like protein [Planktothrix sp. UBA8407]|nr:HipA-like protein [Planktothrix sp. UBA8407]HBK22219.1 HipA-like protein [Planktothrix sp. UBA10369]